MFEIVTDPEHIRHLKEQRIPLSDCRDTIECSALVGLDPEQAYTLDVPRTCGGRSTFLGTKIEIGMSPTTQDEWINFSVGSRTRRASLDTAECPKNTIKVGNAIVVEHVMGGFTAAGLLANYSVKPQDDSQESPSRNAISFPAPTWEGGMLPMVTNFTRGVTSLGKKNCLKVAESVGVLFKSGAYWIFDPPDKGDRRLFLDHQLIHKNNGLGSQRHQIQATAATLTHYLKARAAAYQRGRPLLGRILAWSPLNRLQNSLLSRKKFAFVGKQGLLNPSPEFGDATEIVRHELVDKAGAVSLLGRFLAGTVWTYRTNHKLDKIALDAIRPRLTEM